MNNKIKVFCDGIFDLFHIGHLKHLKNIKDYFSNKEVYLTVGIVNDKLASSYKRKPIFSEDQRKKILEACIYVDEVIIINNLNITEDFLDSNNIDFVFHVFMIIMIKINKIFL